MFNFGPLSYRPFNFDAIALRRTVDGGRWTVDEGRRTETANDRDCRVNPRISSHWKCWEKRARPLIDETIRPCTVANLILSVPVGARPAESL